MVRATGIESAQAFRSHGFSYLVITIAARGLNHLQDRVCRRQDCKSYRGLCLCCCNHDWNSKLIERPNTIEDAMSMVLAALSLLGLGIFGPGIANGIVSGGPQLGAGAAVGTGVAAGGVVAAGVAGAGLAAGAAGGVLAAAARGSASVAAATSNVVRPMGGAAGGAASNAGGVGQGGASAGASSAAEPPAWAARMKRSQTVSRGVSAATNAVRSGDHGGGGASVDLSEGGH